MKKNNLKSCICCFLAGVLVTIGVPAVAKTSTEAIQVTYSNIKIYADGKPVDTTGTEAFIYNGTTYLPVRAVGNAFNKAIDWDAANSAVYIGTRPTPSPQPTVLLEDYDYFTKTADIDELGNGGKDNLGNVHGSGYMLNGSGGTIEYILDGKYQRFAGTIGIPYDRKDSNRETAIKIFGDGKLLYSSQMMRGGVKPENFNIDISGVLNLKIEVVRDDVQTGCKYTTVCIYDAGFYS